VGGIVRLSLRRHLHEQRAGRAAARRLVGDLEGQMLLRWVLADRPPLPACEIVALG
jgi:hypothetical protein